MTDTTLAASCRRPRQAQCAGERLMKTFLYLLALLPLPAQAQSCSKDWKRVSYHAANLADKLATYDITTNRGGREANPILKAFTGKQVSLGEALAGVAFSSAIYEVGLHHYRNDCKTTKLLQNGGLILQGGITTWTVGVRFNFW